MQCMRYYQNLIIVKCIVCEFNVYGHFGGRGAPSMVEIRSIIQLDVKNALVSVQGAFTKAELIMMISGFRSMLP